MHQTQNLLLSIGAMKAGTSWLYMQLRGHPAVDATPAKEIHYFAHCHTPYKMLDFPVRLRHFRAASQWFSEDQPDTTRRLLDWYRRYLTDPVDDRWLSRLFEDPQGSRWCSEFSNLSSLLGREGWDHVHRFGKQVRVLFAMREPLDRLWSHTKFHLQFTGMRNHMASWTQSDYRRFLELPEMASQRHYARILETLAENLAPEEYRYFWFDRIAREPLELLREIEGFLGIAQASYDLPTLAQHHNRGIDHAMPQEFVLAARPLVEAELELLDQRGIDIPGAWKARCCIIDPARVVLAASTR
jgi:Sulfotransferase family